MPGSCILIFYNIFKANELAEGKGWIIYCGYLKAAKNKKGGG